LRGPLVSCWRLRRFVGRLAQKGRKPALAGQRRLGAFGHSVLLHAGDLAKLTLESFAECHRCAIEPTSGSVDHVVGERESVRVQGLFLPGGHCKTEDGTTRFIGRCP
jgi:hypothetical protein